MTILHRLAAFRRCRADVGHRRQPGSRGRHGRQHAAAASPNRRATHASGLHCTLPIGHDGDHVAQEFDPRDVLRWPVLAASSADSIAADIIDDIDKARPTEYAAEQFFEILNAIYEYQHQLVVTTNLRVKELADHFDRADERFGGAIVRRLTENAKIYEMF